MDEHKVTVLLVEDDVGDAEYIGELLEEIDSMRVDLVRVDRLSQGVERLLSVETPVDLVLLDLSLPDSRGGLHTLHEIVKHAVGLPIVILTGLSDRRLAVDAVKAGAQDYLDKGSISPEILERTIRYSIERKRVQMELVVSSRRYRALFDQMSSGVAVFRPTEDGRDFIIMDFNGAGERIDRIDRRDVLGKWVTEVYPGIEEMGFLEVLRQVNETGEVQHYPAAYYSDGRVSGWRENHVYKLSTGEVVAVFDDVSELVQKDEDRRNHIRELEFLSNAAMCFVEMDPEDNVHRVIGELLKEVIPDSFIVVTSVDQGAGSARLEYMSSLGPYADRVRGIFGRDPVGMTYPIVSSSLPTMRSANLVELPGGMGAGLFDSLGEEKANALGKLLSIGSSYIVGLVDQCNVLGCISIFLRKGARLNNIHLVEAFANQSATALKMRQAKEAERLGEERYRAIFETAPSGILIADPTGKVQDCNEQSSEILGRPRRLLRNSMLREFLVEEERGEFDRMWSAASTGRSEPGREFRFLDGKGSPVDIMLSSSTLGGGMDGGSIAIGPSTRVDRSSNIVPSSDVDRSSPADPSSTVGRYSAIIPSSADGSSAVTEDDITIIISLVDITAAKLELLEREATIELLRLSNNPTDRHCLLELGALHLQNISRCDAVGIRFQDDSGDYPFEATRGFPDGFLETEGTICGLGEDGLPSHDQSGRVVLECICGATARRSPGGLERYYTERGSYWTVDSSELVVDTRTSEPGRTYRNRCHEVGFRTIIIIPMGSGRTVNGLVQMCFRSTHAITLAEVHMYERLVDKLYIVLRQVDAEIQKRRSEKEIELRNMLARCYLTQDGEDVFAEMTRVMMDGLGASYGTFVRISEDGAHSYHIIEVLEDSVTISSGVPEISKELWKDPWQPAFIGMDTHVRTTPIELGGGRVLENAMASPLVDRGAIIGGIIIGGKPRGFDMKDREVLRSLVSYVTPILASQMTKEHEERKRVEAEHEVQDKLEFEEALFDISSLFVGSFDYIESLGKALSIIGPIVDADMVGVFDYMSHGSIAQGVQAWSSASGGRAMGCVQTIPMDEFDVFRERMVESRMFFIHDIADIPEGAEYERRWVEENNVTSLFGVPITTHDLDRGFILMCTKGRRDTWGPMEVQGIQMLADILGNTIERLEAEQQVRDREEVLRNVSTAAYDAMIMLDHEGRISFWNDAAERIFGHSSGEALGAGHDLIAPGRFHVQHQAAFPAFRETGEGAAIGRSVELMGRHKDGHEFPVEMSLSPIQVRGQWNAVAIVRDISERKRTELERRRWGIQSTLVHAIPHLLRTKQDNDKVLHFVLPYVDSMLDERFPQFRGSGLVKDVGKLFCELIQDLGGKFGLESTNGRHILKGTVCPWSKGPGKNPFFCYLCRALGGRIVRYVKVPDLLVRMDGTIIRGDATCNIVL